MKLRNSCKNWRLRQSQLPDGLSIREISGTSKNRELSWQDDRGGQRHVELLHYTPVHTNLAGLGCLAARMSQACKRFAKKGRRNFSTPVVLRVW